MAVIGKIREKSGLLVFIVGLGLLLFIIPFDRIIQSFQGTGEQPLGEINGTEIMDSKWKFNERAQNMFNGYSGVPEDYKIQQETQLWNQIMIDTLLKLEVEKLGLQVSNQELVDYLILGDYPDDNLKEQFSFELTPGGEKVFRKDSIISWYNRTNSYIATLTGDQLAQAKSNMYYTLDLPLKESRLKKKYNAMAKFAVIATNAETTKSLLEKNASLEISYVAKDANTVPDDSVNVTEADIKKYFEQNKAKAKWKIEDDFRSFEYALIDIKPTDADKEMLKVELDKMKIGFSKASNDSAFVKANAATPIDAYQQNPSALNIMPMNEFDPNQSDFSEEVKAQITNSKKGDVVGPFNYTSADGVDKVLLAKITNAITRNETEVRHILIGTKTQGLVEGVNDAEIAAQSKLADSLVNVLKADNSKFAALAAQFTDDKQGFAMNKGYYNVYPEAGLVPEFKNFALDNPVGSVQSVKTDYGYHVMEITKRGEFTHNYIALIDKDVVPSKETKMTVFEDAGLAFAESAEKDFSKAVTEFGLESKEDEFRVSYPMTRDLGYMKPLVEWSFAEGRKTGDVSTPIETKDGKYLVAKIKSVANYGVPTYEAVKNKMKDEVLRMKKLDYLAAKVNGVKTLEEASQILTNSPAGIDNNSINLSMDGFPGLGMDDVKAIASAYLIKNTNEVSVIKGDKGVYVVVVNNKNFTPAPTEIGDEKALLTSQKQGYVENNLVLSLFKMADVKDWRMKSKIAQANQNN